MTKEEHEKCGVDNNLLKLEEAIDEVYYNLFYFDNDNEMTNKYNLHEIKMTMIKLRSLIERF